MGSEGVAGVGLGLEGWRRFLDESDSVRDENMSDSWQPTLSPAQGLPMPSKAQVCGRGCVIVRSGCGGSSICTHIAGSCS